jgi:hypothetical protein
VRQNINLYQPIFRRERKVFSAGTMVMMLGLLVLGLAALQAWGNWRHAQLQEQVAQLQAQEREAISGLRNLDGLWPGRGVSPARRGAVDAAEVERDLKRRALQVLDAGRLGDQEGFAGHLEALARQRVEPVWLTRIRIAEGGRRLTLEGLTHDAPQVPVYLQRLAEEPAYRGTEYRTMRLDRAEDERGRPAMSFHLSTEADGREARREGRR